MSHLECAVLRDSGVWTLISRRVRLGVEVIKLKPGLVKGDFLFTAALSCDVDGDARRCWCTIVGCVVRGEAVMVTKEIGESEIDHLIGGGTNFVCKGGERR